MSEFIARFAALPAFGIAAIVLMLAYALESELRFGSRAKSFRPGPQDRLTTWVLSVAAGVPIFGLVLALKADTPGFAPLLPAWFKGAVLPGLPAAAWVGIAIGAAGLLLRLWAVLTLRERYTRTLQVGAGHVVAADGPYRWVRHPGYLGSLLCLNGIALASGNWVTLAASLAATSGAYAYRIRTEERMLLAAFGESYADYMASTGALLPLAGRRRG